MRKALPRFAAARPPGTAKGGEETARRNADARPPGTAKGGEETARRTGDAGEFCQRDKRNKRRPVKNWGGACGSDSAPHGIHEGRKPKSGPTKEAEQSLRKRGKESEAARKEAKKRRKQGLREGRKIAKVA